jgi:hypothetical protein
LQGWTINKNLPDIDHTEDFGQLNLIITEIRIPKLFSELCGNVSLFKKMESLISG